MKLNIDKDQLLKNKFWIMLIVAVPLILAGQYIVMGPVAEDIEKTKKKVTAELRKPINPPFYNNDNIEKKNAEAKAIQKQEREWWGQLYAEQAPSLFWPKGFEDVYPMMTGKFLRELKYTDAGNPPGPDDQHHFSGKLISRGNISITVQGKDNKKEVFYRTARDDMRLGGLDFFNLPVDKDVQVTYQTGRYFNDKLTDTEQANYLKEYSSQIRPILSIVEPVNDEGEGVVILKDWLVPKKAKELPPATVGFLRFVPSPWKADADISEEAWLAQEDLWIQKEFYRLIRQANDYVGKMDGKGVTALNTTATFKNIYFELNLKLLSADKLQVTIKNLQNRRQKLEVKFRVTFIEEGGKESIDKITVEGEPLDPIGTQDAKGKAKDSLTQVIDLPSGLNRKGIADVEQALTWDTAAVRRIDLISIGSASPAEMSLNHRTFPDGLKPLKPDPKIEVPQAGGDGDGGRIRPRQGDFPPPGGPGALLPGVLVNGLNKYRYSEPPSEQTRRLPVAISLIVDQDHVDRVLTAFSNSKYRFVLNQMLINRYPLSVRPNLALNEKAGPGGVFPKGFPPRPMFPGPGGVPDANQGGDEETEANVELVLYGTVTLYERFPPRDPAMFGAAPPKQ